MGLSFGKRRRGFTWVEVLLVMLVTAVCLFVVFLLVPMLFPYEHYRPRQPACMNNEMQIGLAFIQYVQDNDERMPPGTQPTPGLGWAGQVYPYIKSVQVFHCPEDVTKSDTATVSVVSYGYNSNIPLWFAA
ncbi:MAG: type II secretion system protein, partial [Armatimonadetes bacterium]|nr:type II secretion system protein [Armatimonadota bacterium]